MPGRLASIGETQRGWIDRWILRRVRRQTGVVEIQRQRLYILPTRFGWGFALMDFVLLLGATNYANSMGFVLCFLLAALGLVTLHHTHANLLKLQVHAHPGPANFVGEPLRFRLQIDNPSTRARYDLQVAWAASAAHSHGDVEALGKLQLHLDDTARTRGYHPAPAFRVLTEFPLGLFRAWTWIELDMGAWVYPRPVDSGIIPSSDAGEEEQGRPAPLAGDDFLGLRRYRPGDPLGRVHWKRQRPGEAPPVKQFGQHLQPQRWLDWDSLPQLATEARLSQLAYSLLQAHRDGAAFGLRLPASEIGIGDGDAHLHRCLLALAMFEQPSHPSRR